MLEYMSACRDFAFLVSLLFQNPVGSCQPAVVGRTNVA